MSIQEITRVATKHERMIVLLSRLSKHAHRVKELSELQKFIMDNEHAYYMPQFRVTSLERKKRINMAQMGLLKQAIQTL